MKDKLFRFCISALEALSICPQGPTAFLASVYLKESNFLAILPTPVHFSLLAKTNFTVSDIDDLQLLIAQASLLETSIANTMLATLILGNN